MTASGKANHDSFTLERTYHAPPVRVFAAWADVIARQRWSPPNDRVEIRYIVSEFRVNGRDIARCGPKGDLRFGIETHYVDITPPRRIVMTETVDANGQRLSVAILTVFLTPEGQSTRLRFTAQITALDDSGLVSGARAGWSAALDNLAKEVNSG
ncbi:MAG: SRPBCC domain-containing protein [Hyphomicrobiaceae bacterium]